MKKRQRIVRQCSPWVGCQSLPAVGYIDTPIIVNLITITKIHNNENSTILSMNHFSLETFIYAISDCDRKYTFVSDAKAYY